MTSRLLDLPSLLKLQSLTLRARLVAEGALQGLHRAAHHGSSVEFAEHKEYAPGDELRWQPVDGDTFDALERRAAAGQLARAEFVVTVA